MALFAEGFGIAGSRTGSEQAHGPLQGATIANRPRHAAAGTTAAALHARIPHPVNGRSVPESVMNPAEETNLRAEVVVLREMVKLLIAQLPGDAAVTAALDAVARRVVDAAPQFTQERVALQRAVKLIDPVAIQRKP
jgi:hypothetical protein